ncbi:MULTISPECIES: hypothetical protein [Burkholderia]|uniref:hypothetical protein n=1 Tax=Burkholderia TaxID=32008 RepID=UPI00114C9C5C|nr:MULTISPECIES: hypothetical protein [Burkholderia]MBJ9685356.1 hypothetical protein [Burkholderia multivorans]MBU9693954.1 hypothetical protein [Burkholderia multivorans]
MENLTDHTPEPSRGSPALRGFCLAWVVFIAAYWTVTSIDPIRNLFWRGYFFLAPPIAVVAVAAFFAVRGEKRFAGGMFAGLVSVMCVIVYLLFSLFFGNSQPIVNGWK